MKLNQLKTLAISGCGAGIEYYDFAIFAYFAPVIAKSFFPEESVALGIIYAFLILALGYFIRPIGGLIFGFIGDKYGRKTSFFFTMLTLALSTLLMAILPSTEIIGISTAIIFALLRIIQGLAIGGEIPTAISYSIEHFPKKKGMAISVIFSCLGLGIMLSTFVFMVISYIPVSNPLYEYGWRIAFLFGAALSILIYFLRKGLYETPEFLAFKKEYAIKNNKIKHTKNIVIGILLVAPAAMLTTQLFLFLPSYAETYLTIDKKLVSDLIFYGSCVMIFSCFLGGIISDYVNKKLFFCCLTIATSILGHLFYSNLINGFISAFTLMLIFALFGMMASTYTVIIAEMTHIGFRCRSIGLSYNISYSIFSAPIPALSVVILDKYGFTMLPFWLISGSTVLGIIGMLLLALEKYSNKRFLLSLAD